MVDAMTLSHKLQASAIGLGLIATAAVFEYAPLPYRHAVIPMAFGFGIWGVHFGMTGLREWWFAQKPTDET